MVGNCDTGSSCAYTNTLSWKNPDTPLAVDVNPRSVFERLFGNVDPSLSPSSRARRALYRRSMLDLTRESARKLELDLGPADRRKMDEYLTSVREVEQRMAAMEKDAARCRPVDKPAGIPFDFRLCEAHVRSSGDRVPDRPDAGEHDDDRARRQRADLSRRSRCPIRTIR